MKLPHRIEAERIVLKHPVRPTFELAKKLYKVVDESRETLREWLCWVDKTNSAEDEFTNYLIDINQKKWANATSFGYLIYKKGTSEILGNINLCNIVEKDKTAEIGYWLSNSAVGHGYMQEAIHTLEQIAFEKEINRIIIKNDTKNLRSAHVAERSGYVLDGIMRQDAWDEVHHCFRNTNIWSKLKSDWQQNKK